MARSRTRKLTVTVKDVQKLEGLIQELNGMSAEWRPNAIAHVYIAQHLGVSSRTAQQWIRRAKKAARSSDTAGAFYSAASKIADLLSEHLTAVAFKMARDPGNRNALRAAQWLLPKINPVLFGSEVDIDEEDDLMSVGGIDQAVFDEMTDEQIARVDALQQKIAEAMTECGEIVADVQQRLYAKRAGVDVDAMH